MSADESRFADLYGKYSRHVYAYCYRRAGPDSAEDAAAETFLVAWRKFDQLPEGPAALPWLYQWSWGSRPRPSGSVSPGPGGAWLGNTTVSTGEPTLPPQLRKEVRGDHR